MLGGIASWATAEVVGKAALFARVPAALSTARARQTVSGVVPWKALAGSGVAAVGAIVATLVLERMTERLWVGLQDSFVHRIIPLAFSGLGFGLAYLVLLAWVRRRAVRFAPRPVPEETL
jgi:hypothetical protein